MKPVELPISQRLVGSIMYSPFVSHLRLHRRHPLLLFSLLPSIYITFFFMTGMGIREKYGEYRNDVEKDGRWGYCVVTPLVKILFKVTSLVTSRSLRPLLIGKEKKKT
ncbi:hypothetical protein OUZ56_000276 [Daphnia magna]|uniref:Transmembrane protein n=1 Tax=Daphnia magna TaxID=35525 RepID=A0ABQ9ZZ69_9CRUS|nr:hypothetical protein OUZ56_000276 [Daphnia magna]